MSTLLTVLSTILLLAVSAQARMEHLEIPPSAANPETAQIRGSHQVFFNAEIPSRKTLLITLGGTQSLPTDFAAFDKVAADMGFDVVAIDYDNLVISTTCKTSTDLLCFDKFRTEIATGEPVSDLVNVTKVNSLESRITDTLNLLAKKDSVRWGRYLKNKNLRWDRTIIAGHSQGAGHAAYLSKLHTLKGVIMFAGPQDRFEDGRSVNWIVMDSKTPASRYYSFIHQRDFFGSEHQIAVAKIFLKKEKFEDHVVVTNAEVADGHMAVIHPQFTETWKELLVKAAK